MDPQLSPLHSSPPSPRPSLLHTPLRRSSSLPPPVSDFEVTRWSFRLRRSHHHHNLCLHDRHHLYRRVPASPVAPQPPASPPQYRAPPTPPPICVLPTCWRKVLCRTCHKDAHDISHQRCMEGVPFQGKWLPIVLLQNVTRCCPNVE